MQSQEAKPKSNLLKKIQELSFFAKVGAFLSFGFLFCFGLILLFFVYLYFKPFVPPVFFPLNDSKGTYKITKNCPNSQGWEQQPNADGYAYCVEYKGPGVFMNSETEKHDFFRITVGKSRADLEPYIDKYVRLKGGDFVYSTEQCIQSKCMEIGSMAMLDVYGVEMVK